MTIDVFCRKKRTEQRSEASALQGYGCLLLLLAACGCSKASAQEAAPSFAVDQDSVHLSGNASSPVQFVTEAAVLGPPVTPPVVTGRVATVETLTARSFAPLNGRVSELRVRVGDRVQKGDKLLRVQTPELASIQHDLRAANLAVGTKQAMLERLQKLSEVRAASDNDILVAQNELAQAKLEGEASGAVLRSLAVTPADNTSYWVVAPRAGTIVSLNVTPGAEVGPGSEDPIAVVADLDEVLVVADLPPKEAALTHPGDVAMVTVPGTSTQRQGTVETVSEVVDPQTQTVPVRVRVNNDGRLLRANGYVDVGFEAQKSASVLTVPPAAVVSDGARSVVFVETEPGLLKKREVHLGRQGQDRTEIVEGIQPGERVVSSGALLLLNAIDLRG